MDDEFSEGLRGRDEGMRRADWAVPEEWKKLFEAAIYEVARIRLKFTSEDVRDHLKGKGIKEPAELRSIGAIMRRVAATGAIFLTGETRRYRSRSRHTGVSYVWCSRLYKPEVGVAS